ncbi:MAG: OadG family transporter subunit [Bacteroidia bacterium]|nr:OadG family transporter subunit [Bacteroidia bacterium]
MRKTDIAKGFIALACSMAMNTLASAQTASDLTINEIKVERDSTGAVTEAWVEIFNPTYSTVDMARLYLSNDRNNLTKSIVPQGLTSTQFLPRGFVVFECDGKRSDGPLHTTFDLSDSKYVYLVESNGQIVIDSCEVPQNGSLARTLDGIGTWETPKENSKGFSNQMAVVKNNSDRFMEVDPYGAGMALISISVVFGILIILAIVFSAVGNFFVWREKTAEARAQAKIEKQKAKEAKALEAEEEQVAIATVVAMYMLDAHDDAAGQLTIVQNENHTGWQFPFKKH